MHKALNRVAGRDRLSIFSIAFPDLTAGNEGGGNRTDIIRLLAAFRLIAVDDRLFKWSIPFAERFGLKKGR
jgi:hypothetical protein